MDYYNLAEEPFSTAVELIDIGRYRMSVHMSTLAMDLYLKSILYRIDPRSDYLVGHDHIGIFRLIEKRYPKPELSSLVKLSRKYFNSSRYSKTEDLSIYTKQLAQEFVAYAQQIKNYVDNDCAASIDDLKNRFDR